MTRDHYSMAELGQIANAVRRQVVKMVARIGFGYLQQGLGTAEILVSLYFSELRLDENDPAWSERDRCILSAAHNTAGFYAVLAERGLIPRDDLSTYMGDGSPYEVNASERVGPLVEATCGSLGQGLSVGMGMALAARRRQRDSRIYVILGDGELQEGQVWEAALSAGSFGLSNLCVVVDRNCMQVEGHSDSVLHMEPIAAKWEAFGWQVLDLDGHDFPTLLAAFDAARAERSKPTIIIARTTPGKGVPYVEGRYSHFVEFAQSDAEAALAHLEGEAA